MFKSIVLGLLGLLLAVAASPATAAAPLPQGSEPVQLDPAKFSARIDNPYFPLVPGTATSIARPTREPSSGWSSASARRPG